VRLNRDGTILRPIPSSIRCTTVAFAHKVIGRPAWTGPSQNCCPLSVKFPDAGTIRMTSTARSVDTAVALAGLGTGCRGGPDGMGGSSAVEASEEDSFNAMPSPPSDRNRSAGKAMSKE